MRGKVMNKSELVDLLCQIAEKDLANDADLRDHPCMVAIRAINTAFDDIELLRSVAPKKKGSKRMQMLTSTLYNPKW